MKMIKTINDLDKKYDEGAKQVGDVFLCPVCDKEYKTKKGAESHIEKRDCYDLKQLFQHTQTELTAYTMYKELIGLLSPKTIPDIRTFKKSPYYNGCLRFTIFCNIHELNDQKTTYLTWLNEFKNCGNINGLMAAAIKESNVREFRDFLQQFPQFIDSATFYDRYRKSLIDDEHFFIRSLERAKIGLKFLLEKNDFPFERVMENLAPDYQIRFEELANKILVGE